MLEHSITADLFLLATFISIHASLLHLFLVDTSAYTFYTNLLHQTSCQDMSGSDQPETGRTSLTLSSHCTPPHPLPFCRDTP
jgi:hypothetical protein